MECPNLSFMDSVDWNGRQWFFENRWKALCSIDDTTLKLSVESVYGKDINIGGIFVWKDELYLFSQNSFVALKYNANSCTFYETKWDGAETEWLEPKHMALHSMVGDRVYIIPAKAKCKSGNIYIAYYDLVREKFHSFVFNCQGKGIEDDFCLFSFPSMRDGVLYAGMIMAPQYLCADVSSGRYSLLTLPNEKIYPFSVCEDGGKVWFTQVESPDICYIKDNDMVRFPVDEKINQPYSRILSIEEHIIVLPRYGNTVVLIDKTTEKVYCLHINDLIHQGSDNNGSKIYSCTETDSTIFLNPLNIGKMLCIDKHELYIYEAHLECDADIFIDKIINKQHIWYENNEILTLRNIVEYLALKNSDYSNDSAKYEKSHGELIYESVIF